MVFDAAELIQPSYTWLNLLQRPIVPRIIVSMLVCLLFLHIFWTVIILKIVHKTITAGQAEDVRSDSEEDSDSEIDDKNDKLEKKQKKKLNGSKMNGKAQMNGTDQAISNGQAKKIN